MVANSSFELDPVRLGKVLLLEDRLERGDVEVGELADVVHKARLRDRDRDVVGRRSCTGSMMIGGGGSVLVLATPTPSASSWVRSTLSRLRVPSTSSVCVRSGLTCVISRRPRPMTCSGRISALAVNGRRPSTTVTFRTSQPSRSIITLTMALIVALGLVDVAGGLARLVEVLLGDLALGVGVDDEDLGFLEAELLGLPEVLADRVGVDVLLGHDEEHWLGAELLVDLVVLLPALHGGPQPVAVLLADVVLGDVSGSCLGCLGSSSLVTISGALTMRSSTAWASG